MMWHSFSCRAAIVAVVLANAFFAAAPAFSQSGSDIYLIGVRSTDEDPTFAVPINVTLRAGYDNQPFFLSDSNGFYFTSIDGEGDDSQADIYRYDIQDDRVVQVTHTTESEYSPTPLPNGGFSSVRVEADGAQRLWEFDADGGNPRVILPDVTGIGYHAWGNDNEVILFILGEPHELHRAGRDRSNSEPITLDIGRAMHPIPGQAAWSFTQQEAPDDWRIRSLTLDGDVAEIAPLLPGVQDYTWTPAGTMWLFDHSTLFEWDPKAQPPQWRRLHDFSANGLENVNRLDVSPDGNWLVVVVSERPAANQNDVVSIDSILDALYDVISGPAGQELDMDRMRSLFSPDGRLVDIEPGRDGRMQSRTLSLEDWIAEFQPLLESIDFHERELGRRVEQWGHFAHAWSSFEGVSQGGGRVAQGINTIQLRYDDERWWIVSIVFEAETQDNPVPADLGGTNEDQSNR